MCDFLDKNIKLQNFSYVLNCCIKCSGVFFTDSEMNGDEDVFLPFIIFHHYKKIKLFFFAQTAITWAW